MFSLWIMVPFRVKWTIKQGKLQGVPSDPPACSNLVSSGSKNKKMPDCTSQLLNASFTMLLFQEGGSHRNIITGHGNSLEDMKFDTVPGVWMILLSPWPFPFDFQSKISSCMREVHLTNLDPWQCKFMFFNECKKKKSVCTWCHILRCSENTCL